MLMHTCVYIYMYYFVHGTQDRYTLERSLSLYIHIYRCELHQLQSGIEEILKHRASGASGVYMCIHICIQVCVCVFQGSCSHKDC